jgi:hypothetical protein
MATRTKSTKTVGGKRRQAQSIQMLHLRPEELDDLTPNPSNRVTDSQGSKNRIAILAKEFVEHGFSQHFPIVVSGDLIIRSGHHRWYAAKKAQCPVWIQIDDETTLEDMARMESHTTKWKTSDWLTKHAKEGVGDFPRIALFMDDYGFGVKVALMILSNRAAQHSRADNQLVLRGEYQVKDWDKAIWKAERIKELGAFLPKSEDYRNCYFASAVMKCLETKGFKTPSMITKIKDQLQRFRLQRNMQENLQMFEEIYNFGRRAANRIKLQK